MNDENPAAAAGGEPPPTAALARPPARKARLGRPIGSGGHRQRREAQLAAAEVRSVQLQIDMELQQLREMQAMERELRQLQQMQAIQHQHGQLEREQVQREQIRAAATAGGGGLDLPVSAGRSDIGPMASAIGGASPAFAAAATASLPPHIAAAHARVAALERQLAQDQAKFKEQNEASAAAVHRHQQQQRQQQQQQQQQLAPAEAKARPPSLPRTAAAEDHAFALDKQLAAEKAVVGLAKGEEDEAARGGAGSDSAANSVRSSLSTAPAVKALIRPNPRRPPTSNSGFPLPRLSSSDNAYLPPKIKSLDGFRSAYNQMKKNIGEGKKKRKVSVTLGDTENDATSTSVGNVGADDISLPKATVTRDIFASMVHRRRIDLRKHDLSVSGMYSVNISDRIAKTMVPRKQQKERGAGHEEAAPAPAVLAPVPAPVPAPVDTVKQPHFQPPQKKQRTQHHEQQLQMIADLKKQKAQLDEQYEQMKAAKKREAAQQATPELHVPQPAGLLPPILPNSAVGVNINTSPPRSKSIQERLEAIARLEQEKAFLDSQLAMGKRAFSAHAQQKAAQGQLPPTQPKLPGATEDQMRTTAVSQPQEGQPRVANTTLGVASSLLGLVSQQPQAGEAQQPSPEQARTLATEIVGERTSEAVEAEALTDPEEQEQRRE
mmetsp:Transcript_22367/g.48633  ORF Transcript_22367/g.48633 Transcript_22367/m.48633 type:complete len:663 (+) Transcript_22367:188-2176(+)